MGKNNTRRVDVCDIERYIKDKDCIFRLGKKDTIICDFDKVFPKIGKKNLNIFYIPRPAFYRNGKLICDTINAFHHFYDHDKEFITCYINLKVMTDLCNMKYTFKSFLDDIVNRLFSESMIEKVKTFTDEQYRIDLETSMDEEKYVENAHQFKNKHGKILMEISTATKLIIPIISHYYAVRQDMLESVNMKKFLYHCFYALFPLFQGDVNIYNKLYATVDKIVGNSEFSDSGMWKRKKNLGITPASEKTRITKMVIQDLLYKYEFNKIPINLNFVGIRGALKFTIEGKDSHDFSDINSRRSDGKMSGLEQLEMNAAKIDERDIIISSHGSHSKVNKLIVKYNVDIDKEDIKFYEENLQMNSTQTNIVLHFFAEDFKGLENMKFIKRKDFYKLIIIMKEELSRRGFRIIPSLVTGKATSKVKGRKMGTKKLSKIKSYPRYYNLMNQYKDVQESINEGIVLKCISMFINIPMTYVDHNNKNSLGEDIEINENLIIDETLRLIEMF